MSVLPTADPASPLAELDPAQPSLFRDDAQDPVFTRLRREDPVHLTPDGPYGRYWSVTRFEDIVTVLGDPQTFSSRGGANLSTRPEDVVRFPMFIASDGADHESQRALVAPTLSAARLRKLEPLIRAHTAQLLDALPHGSTFDWVSRVSRDLTTFTLALVLGMPTGDRARLGPLADALTQTAGEDGALSLEAAGRIFAEAYAYFSSLWAAAAREAVRDDLISVLAHAAARDRLTPEQLVGNLMLFVVAGSDSTRNSISASVLALCETPEEMRKLRADPDLVSAMAAEIFRWHTPFAHALRVVTRDTELRGRQLKAGDRLALWYVSGNRDDTAIEQASIFRVARPRPRLSLAFGSGVHHCMGARLAEMQMTILWREVLNRFSEISVCGEPQRVASIFIRGFDMLPVQLRSLKVQQPMPTAAAAAVNRK